MTNLKRRTWPAVVAGALGMGAVAAWAAEPTQQDLVNQLNDLKAKIAALEGQKTATQAQADATADAVRRNADAHSMLLAAGAAGAAGHGAVMPGLPDYGFTVGQGDFALNIAAGLKFRGVMNYGDERKRGTDDDFQTGFEVTVARLMLQGYAWDPNLTYFIQWGTDGPDSGGIVLYDAVINWKLADQFGIKAGQFKDPISHEAAISTFDIVGTTRSLANELLGIPDGTAGRVQGAGLTYGGPKDMIMAQLLLTDGVGSANTNFSDASGVNWGLAGRVDVKIQGNDWSDYADQTAKGTDDTLLVVGGGIDVTQGDNFTAYRFVVDGQFESQGLGVYGAFIGNFLDLRNVGAGDDEQFDWAFVIQASYLLSQELEIFGRYDLIKFEDEQTPVDQKTFHEIAAGVNYYLGKGGAAGNNAKMTFEVAWLPKGSPVAVAYNDILGGTEETEIVVRAQLQLRP